MSSSRKKRHLTPHTVYHERLEKLPDQCNGLYKELRFITKGGAGTVYRAKTAGRLVAIKEIAPAQEGVEGVEGKEEKSTSLNPLVLLGEEEPTDTNTEENPSATWNLGLTPSDLTELWITNAYRHDNLVHALDVSLGCNAPNPPADALLRLILPFAVGGSLIDFLPRLKTLPSFQRIAIAHDLLCGLHQLHATKLAYIDLKSHNLLLFARRGVPEAPFVAQLTDFGSVLPLRANTSRLEIQGTPLYTSPEFLCNKKRIGKELTRLAPAADVWGVGLILLEVLTGESLSTILKTCPKAPDEEWLAGTICLIGEPEQKWLDVYDAGPKTKKKGKKGSCSVELTHRRNRMLSDATAAGLTPVPVATRGGFFGRLMGRERALSTAPNGAKGLVDRLEWSPRSGSGLSQEQFNQFLHLIKQCLQWDPMRRITVAQALRSPLFVDPRLKCTVDLTVGDYAKSISSIDHRRALKRPDVVGLPENTSLLVKQFSKILLDKAEVPVGKTDDEFAVTFVVAKLFHDPIVPNLVATAEVYNVSRRTLLAAERRFIAKIHGQLN